MSASRPTDSKARTTWVAFAFGIPLAAAVIAVLKHPTFHGTLAQRYVSHPVELVEIVLFCIAIGNFLVKYLQSLRERRALQTQIIPDWNGQPVSADEAPKLLEALDRQPAWLQKSLIAQRARDVLDFVCQRRSARDLDDQLRCLSDNDHMKVDNSYGLVRFICWACPILGFLGTVLGIAESVAGVTPEVLEQSISSVTEGLALAFDTTGLALALTMVVMFFSFFLERREQAILQEVDTFVDLQLTHRFTRSEESHQPFLSALQEHTRGVLDACGQMVRKQAEVWADVLLQAEQRMRQTEEAVQARLIESLAMALTQTQEAHSHRLALLNQEGEKQTTRLLAPLGELTRTMSEQQKALTPVAEGMRQVGEALQLLQEEEGSLLRLERELAQNLAALQGTGAFEQAVHSLNAAIHLLSGRLVGPQLKLHDRPRAA